MGCTQGGTYRPPYDAMHPSDNQVDDQQALLQQSQLSQQPAGASFVAQPVSAQQQLQHVQAAQQHIVPNPSGNPLCSWQQLLQQQQEQQQQLFALIAAQQATPPSYPVYGPTLQPGSYVQPSYNAPYSADPAQQWQANLLAQQWQQALAQLRAPAVTPLQYAYPPGAAPALGAENGSVLPHPAPVEAAAHLPPASVPNAQSARAHYLAPAGPADITSCQQTGLHVHPAPANHAADAAQQQAAVSEPVQEHANQQPNFFAALWDGMRSAGAAALRRQQLPTAAPPPPDPQLANAAQPAVDAAAAVPQQPAVAQAEAMQLARGMPYPEALGHMLNSGLTLQPGTRAVQPHAAPGVKAEQGSGSRVKPERSGMGSHGLPQGQPGSASAARSSCKTESDAYDEEGIYGEAVGVEDEAALQCCIILIKGFVGRITGDLEYAASQWSEPLQGVFEGLKMADAPEADVPSGKMTVALHPYQKRALGWMKKRENPGNVNAACGGILADEQGLGKTIQALALIVSEEPTREDARAALADAQREQNAMALHPESAQARAARAAGIGINPVGRSAGASCSAEGTDPGGSSRVAKAEVKSEAEGDGPPRKKAKKGPILYQPCGRGEHCTCAICKKAKQQQAKAAEREEKRLWQAELAARKEAKDRAQQGPPKGQPQSSGRAAGAGESKLLLPDIMCPDGSVAKRTLVVCPLCVAQQWVDEVREKAPQLRVALYHGPKRRSFTPALLACYDVIVTTYQTMANECDAAPQGALFRVRWHRCILDEAHLIRNGRTQAAKAATEIKAARRWCLTGTPIINAATDVHMLFVFLQHAPFNNAETFNRLIRNKIQMIKLRNGNRINPNQARRAEGYKELRTAMQAVTLRRMKNDMFDGKPLIVLPPKIVAVEHLRFSEQEDAIYAAFEEKSRLDFKEYLRIGFGANYSHILVLLMRLRQVCIHPWLAQSKDGSIAAVAGSNAEEDPDAHPSGVSVERAAELLGKLTGSDDAIVTACAHGPFCRECILSSLQHQGGDQAEGTCPLCRANLSPAKIYTAAQLQPLMPIDIEEEAAALDASKANNKDGGGDWFQEQERFVSSSKLDAVMRLLEQYCAEDEAAGPGAPPTKIIVFSTFTRALDLMQQRLMPSSIGFLRLDGSMRLSQRTDAIRAFAHDPQARVLLASTKAAGMGLNITCACRAIILDVWWNGAFEDQAVDRCHRLGQMREVKVSKLIMTRRDPSKETVEQRIMAMQEHKRQIAEAALGGEGTSGGARLSLNDLRLLFGIRRRS
ncbi:Helicase-like transcription factor [Coccomyxa sp. Obi]|nr:Helicase-like transcription factor [Coccomyxa sp. Obi]